MKIKTKFSLVKANILKKIADQSLIKLIGRLKDKRRKTINIHSR